MGQSDSTTITSARHERALDYWLGLKTRRGGLPARADIDPNEMREFLAWVTLIDVVRDEQGTRYRARLVGTGIADRHGRDVTGRFDDELYDLSYLTQMRACYGQLLQNRKPLLVTCTIPVPDRVATTYQRLLLPLAGDGDEVDMIMAVFDYPDRNPLSYKNAPRGQSNWEVVELEL